ncbi:MAG TPA: response regulator [Bacteroidia bacterium]|nr:response regulator [Bacteroidia bacterium]
MEQPSEQPLEASIENIADNTEIAIVDDDPGFSIMLKDYLLSSLQLDSVLFANGNEFLKNYRVNDNRKIILDYEFKEGPNGLIILQKIKTLNPMAIVIIVSGQDDLEKAIETLRNGATDYFLKTSKTVFANIVCSLQKIYKMEKNKWN